MWALAAPPWHNREVQRPNYLIMPKKPKGEFSKAELATIDDLARELYLAALAPTVNPIRGPQSIQSVIDRAYAIAEEVVRQLAERG